MAQFEVSTVMPSFVLSGGSSHSVSFHWEAKSIHLPGWDQDADTPHSSVPFPVVLPARAFSFVFSCVLTVF